jgi:hypothetical protein
VAIGLRQNCNNPTINNQRKVHRSISRAARGGGAFLHDLELFRRVRDASTGLHDYNSRWAVDRFSDNGKGGRCVFVPVF